MTSNISKEAIAETLRFGDELEKRNKQMIMQARRVGRNDAMGALLATRQVRELAAELEKKDALVDEIERICAQQDFNDKMNRVIANGLSPTISETVLQEIKEARGK